MNIKDWPSSEQPREKLLAQGAESLSDIELLAIFLRTGIRGKNVMTLSRELISEYGGLKNLITANHQEFTSHKGLGTSKYVQLQASLELAKRYLRERLCKGQQIRGSDDTKDFLSMELGSETAEVFACMFLDNKHRLLSFQKMFRGTINNAQIHIREIVRQALLENSAAVIVAHNHPSGDCHPSNEDVHITQSIYKALEMMDMSLLDHCIIGNGEVYSFAEHHQLNV